MKTSFTFKLTLLAIRLKGIKKQFSSSPIDFKTIRKSDVHDPKGFFKRTKVVERLKIKETLITKINSDTDKLVLYLHGGAFVSGPAQHHWDSLEYIFKETNQNIWMIDYPKAPEFKMETISENIDIIYQKALEQYNSENITLIGDSAGATLILLLVQRLRKESKILPHRLILISPVVDCSFDNPAILPLDKTDPMLGRDGVLSAKKMVAGDFNTKDARVSPLFGDFDKFPTTHLFLAENDITYPDQLLLIEKLKENGVNHTVVFGIHMPHIWPLLPVMKEAKIALKQLINILKNQHS